MGTPPVEPSHGVLPFISLAIVCSVAILVIEIFSMFSQPETQETQDTPIRACLEIKAMGSDVDGILKTIPITDWMPVDKLGTLYVPVSVPVTTLHIITIAVKDCPFSSPKQE